jgi:hypothetical protein
MSTSHGGGTAEPAETPGRRYWWAWAASAVILVLLVALVIWSPWADDTESAAPTPAVTTSTSAPTTTGPTTTAPRTTSSPTSAASQPLTLEALAADLVDVVPASLAAYVGRPVQAWGCEKGPYVIGETAAPLPTAGPLPAGSIAVCRPSPIPAEGEHPVVTVLVIDDAGTYSAALSGNNYPLLLPAALPDGTFAPEVDVPPGQNCGQLLSPDSSFLQEAERERFTPEQTYVGVVLYYFVQDRSPLLDADDDGIPCETKFPASVVDAVWSGGWVPPPQ